MLFLCEVGRKTQEWENLFEEKVGSQPWSLQRSWAKKVFLGRSFALLAPTGVGKTTFGLITALFLASQGGKSYIILPTKLLLEQVRRKLRGWGLPEEELLVVGESSERKKKEQKESLKTARNIDKVLYLLGFTEEELESAYQLVKLKEKRRKDKEELLGFEVGRPSLFLRNVTDVYLRTGNMDADLISRVKELGKGGLVFVSSDYGREGVEKVVRLLREEGVRVSSYEELKDLSAFEEGKTDVLVGISSHRNPLVRGIDIPHGVRYALFYGVPKIVVSLNIETSVHHLLWALLSLRPLLAKRRGEKLKEIDRWIQSLRRYSFLSEEFIQGTPDLRGRIEKLREEIRDFLLSEEIKSLIEESEEITLRKTAEGYSLIVADVTGYLQASGRTSRMYPGGITRGLSYILVDDVKAFNNLMRKVRWFNEEVVFLSAEEADLKAVIREVDEDRRRVKEILSGKDSVQRRELVKPVLIVVESPNKARTIASFFGKPITRRFGDFEVLEVTAGDLYLMITSSLGHILDLAKEGGFHGVFTENGHFTPLYEVIEGKEGTVKGLRQIGEEVESVLIATDPDTEGEKIGWDISAILHPFVRKVSRIEFHEITRKAIRKALREPKSLNENLVRAQIVRRVSDRWVGFEVSRILQSTFGKAWLSGGRVHFGRGTGGSGLSLSFPTPRVQRPSLRSSPTYT